MTIYYKQCYFKLCALCLIIHGFDNLDDNTRTMAYMSYFILGVYFKLFFQIEHVANLDTKLGGYFKLSSIMVGVKILLNYLS